MREQNLRAGWPPVAPLRSCPHAQPLLMPLAGGMHAHRIGPRPERQVDLATQAPPQLRGGVLQQPCLARRLRLWRRWAPVIGPPEPVSVVVAVAVAPAGRAGSPVRRAPAAVWRAPAAVWRAPAGRAGAPWHRRHQEARATGATTALVWCRRFTPARERLRHLTPARFTCLPTERDLAFARPVQPHSKAAPAPLCSRLQSDRTGPPMRLRLALGRPSRGHHPDRARSSRRRRVRLESDEDTVAPVGLRFAFEADGA